MLVCDSFLLELVITSLLSEGAICSNTYNSYCCIKLLTL